MIAEELHCTNHPNRETVLRCGKCGRPMCSDCLIHTPVGLRCKQCANIRPSPIYDVKPARLLLALAAGLATGILGGVGFFAVVGSFSLWLSPLYGLAIGEVVSMAARRKRGPNLQAVAFVSIVAGAILGKYGPSLLFAVLQAGFAGPQVTMLANVAGRDIWLMIFTAVAVLVGLTRVR